MDRDLYDIGVRLYQEANSPEALARRNRDLVMSPTAFLIPIVQPGTLELINRRRVRVPGLRYNVALRLLEVQDSTGSHVWPPGSLRGFYIGRGPDARHFRTYLVRNGTQKRDFVEVLTVDDDSPIVLAVQHSYLHEAEQRDPVLRTVTRPERSEIGQEILAGSGNLPNEPLRVVTLNERNVLRLFGERAAKVQGFAQKENLQYTDLTQVLRMVEYYNQLVVAK
jgi:hypothetical protein